MSLNYQSLLGESSLDATYIVTSEVNADVAKVKDLFVSGKGTLNEMEAVEAGIESLSITDYFRIPSGAGKDKVLTSDAQGLASWKASTLTGDVTGLINANTIADTVVTGKRLTGFISGVGVVNASDSILTGLNKINGNVTTNQAQTNALRTEVNALNTVIDDAAVVDTPYTLVQRSGDGSFMGRTIEASYQVVTPLVKVTNGAGAGKVLTSDNSGNGSWQTPSVVTTVTMAGDVTGASNNNTITSDKVTAKLLTGFSSMTGAVNASDSILTGINKMAGNAAADLTKINTNTSNIATNLTKINTNTSNITANLTKINANTSNIAANLLVTNANAANITDMRFTLAEATEMDVGYTLVKRTSDGSFMGKTIEASSKIVTPLIQIINGSGVNKILTSDGFGNASWQPMATVDAVALAGDVTGSSNANIISDNTVTGKLLIGFDSSTGTVISGDSILQAFSKVVGNANAQLALTNTNTSKIAAHQTSINTNTSNIAAHLTLINANSADIISNRSLINTNAAHIDMHESSINTNTNNIAANLLYF